MKIKIYLLITLLFSFFVSMSQNVNIENSQTIHKSILQEQSEEYSKYNFTKAQQWDSLFLEKNPGMTRKVLPQQKSSCSLNKVVYGWNPYWAGSTYLNYQWNLLSHLCHFSYEVDYTDGTANSTHSWASDPAVNVALANGVKVDLCVTLFSNHATFLGNAAAKQTLITNLINLIQSRGANGVNIDFEGLPSAQSSNFTNFMVDLCTQMHNAIPGSQVSICLYSVDWSNVFDETTLNQYVDMFIIMGYDYYYGGSTTAGPNDPLYNFITSYNQTLTKSITYYLSQGVTPSKLILGLPYYGKQWATVDNTVGSSTTATGTSPFYNTVRANTSGNYSTKLWNATSYTPYYTFQTTGQWYQCWIDDAYSLGERFDIINQRGIGGMGIWALGYDDGYTELWNKIQDKFSTCATVQCSDTIYDMGGPSRNYYNNENYTYTIEPDGASTLSLTFNSFSISDDTLWIYNGPSTASPLIGAYTGTSSPGVVNATGNSITLKFRSLAANLGTGWSAVWQCYTDNISPTTLITAPQPWVTSNFTSTYADNDNAGGSGVNKRFFQILDYNGTEWRGNNSNGFFNDNFNSTLHSEWHTTDSLGAWNVSSGHLNQTYTGSNKTRLSVPVLQDSTHTWLYHWQMSFSPGTTRRAGMYIMAADPTQTYLGSAYLIWFRADDDKCEIYYVKNNTMSGIVATAACTINDNTTYDYKVIYNPATGLIQVFQNNIPICSYTDTQPLKNAGYISLRTGNASMFYDDIKVYKSRGTSALVSVGSASTNDIRFQNPDPSTPSGLIKSICNDNIGNFSTVAGLNLNIDWTAPATVMVNDGLSIDIDTLYQNNQLSASWNSSTDPHSNVIEYWYAVGTTPGDSNTVAWTNNSTNTSYIKNGLSLAYGSTYFVSVKVKNGAGLFSQKTISDGVIIVSPGAYPYISFTASDSIICTGEQINLMNNTTNANSYSWVITGASPSTSTLISPTVVYNSSGIYDVKLIASNINGTDTLLKSGYITVNQSPISAFTTNTVSGQPPLPVMFTNLSTGANSYLWNFGDGNFSTDVNPFNIYTNSGDFYPSLIALNSLCPSDTSTLAIWINSNSINDNSFHSIRVFPLPSNNKIFIEWADEIISEITVYNNLGSICQVKIKSLENKNTEIDVTSLPKGIYYLSIQSKSNVCEMIKVAVLH